MKVLVIGGGGREDALVRKIAESPLVSKVYCAPGNAGIAALAECVALKADDIAGLCAFAKKEAIDLTVVGPEAPLVAGIVDIFKKEGLKVFIPELVFRHARFRHAGIGPLIIGVAHTIRRVGVH